MYCTLLVSCVRCTVGWVKLALFRILMKGMMFAVPLGTVQYGEIPNLFDFGSKMAFLDPHDGLRNIFFFYCAFLSKCILNLLKLLSIKHHFMC